MCEANEAVVDLDTHRRICKGPRSMTAISGAGAKKFKIRAYVCNQCKRVAFNNSQLYYDPIELKITLTEVLEHLGR